MIRENLGIFLLLAAAMAAGVLFDPLALKPQLFAGNPSVAGNPATPTASAEPTPTATATPTVTPTATPAHRHRHRRVS
jgi:hypothetical protein